MRTEDFERRVAAIARLRAVGVDLPGSAFTDTDQLNGLAAHLESLYDIAESVAALATREICRAGCRRCKVDASSLPADLIHHARRLTIVRSKHAAAAAG